MAFTPVQKNQPASRFARVHESSVVEQLVKTAIKAALDNKALKVLQIDLVIGEATGYMEESLKHYFSILSKKTILEGAELKIKYIKPKLKCESCNDYFERERFSFDCPKCGKPGIMTEIGMEFYIDNMEIETE
jgi:hydrogenase nickel incorporation protein HypA/HybF